MVVEQRVQRRAQQGRRLAHRLPRVRSETRVRECRAGSRAHRPLGEASDRARARASGRPSKSVPLPELPSEQRLDADRGLVEPCADTAHPAVEARAGHAPIRRLGRPPCGTGAGTPSSRRPSTRRDRHRPRHRRAGRRRVRARGSVRIKSVTSRSATPSRRLAAPPATRPAPGPGPSGAGAARAPDVQVRRPAHDAGRPADAEPAPRARCRGRGEEPRKGRRVEHGARPTRASRRRTRSASRRSRRDRRRTRRRRS